jgi:hypothetical protein
MDLGLYFRVLWRFRVLMLAGLAVAILLAVFSAARITPSGLKYRKAEQYVSYATLFVTQQGFPWGQLHAPQSADANHFTSLAIVYSQLATTDPVRQILLRGGPIRGTFQVAPVLDTTNQEPLPLISVAAFGDSPQAAITLAKRETSALLTYIRAQQQGNAISADNRVNVDVVRKAQYASLYKGRSMTLPIVVFLVVLIAFSALAFILENARPRMKVVPTSPPRRTSVSDAA